jgi:RHS repeat-associated protein
LEGEAIVVKRDNNPFEYYFPYTDHLGSIVGVTNTAGAIVAEQNFDAWGRKRNPTNWTYDNIPSVPNWLYRGYTGHEHLTEFNLINMNARLYDPVLGRMLSPDNYVGSGGTQGFNRYSYANNNPLSYVDPDGNDPILIGMLIGAAINAATQFVSNDFSFNNWNWGSFAGAVVAGGVGGAVAPALSAAHIGGFAGGAITGASSGFAGSLVTGIINNQSNLLGSVIESTLLGGAIGGVIGALDVVYKNATNENEMGLRIWDGREKMAVQRHIVWGGDIIPKEGTVKNMASSKRNGITQRNIPANPSGTRMRSGISSKTVEIPSGFEGNLTITGNASPAPGEIFQLFADNKLIFSATTNTPISFSLPSSYSTLTWQLAGTPANTGFRDFMNSYINITGTHRGWSGFLFFR